MHPGATSAMMRDDATSKSAEIRQPTRMAMTSQRRDLKVLASCIAILAIMIGLVAYSPTAYRLFCAATGYAGTTQRADVDSGTVSERTITVRFDSNVAGGLPWRFEPAQREMKVHLGEQQLAYFTAENLSDQAIVGHAAYNVTPSTSGAYFTKIQCFCFDDERLDPHEKVDMPVVFFVDPALAKDPELDDLNTITLSYTFFRTPNSESAKDLSRFLASAAPDAAHGRELFDERCAACHALRDNKTGPLLGGVVGRRAGSAPGYRYSPGLASAGLIWTPENLDQWLSDPRKFIAGAKMPVRVIEASSRRDIIGYLENEGREAGDRPAAPSVAQSLAKQHL
jgi:cytochrome c oxidase assembly protein subunit 11